MAGASTSSSALSLISLYEIGKILTNSLDLGNTLRDVLNVLSCYLELRRGVVALKDESGALKILAAANMSTRAAQNGGATLPAGAAEQILRSAMPFVVPNVEEDPILGHEPLPADAALQDGAMVSFIGVPMKTLGQTLGVIAVERVWTHGNQVSFDADVRLLVMVSNLIGQTIRLHQSLATEGAALCPEPVVRPPQAVRRSPAAAAPAPVYELDGVIGVSRAMQAVFAQVHQVAPSKSTVMLRGESGTGKEMMARAVHVLSRRKTKAFVKVNCAALPESLLESELFGHEKGAFTGATHDRKGRFELADGGSLFLDEIGDISRPFQAKLLRVLQEGEFERVGGSRTLKVDVRLIAATNRNLEEAVAKGEFRGDLYYRLNVVPIFVPALRERREDIPLLAQYFLDRFNQENGRSIRFAPSATKALLTCNFPGNVRELENLVNRIATMSRTELIEDFDFPCTTHTCLNELLNIDCRTGTPYSPASSVTAPAPSSAGSATTVVVTEADAGEDDLLTELDGMADEPNQRDRLIKAMEKTGWVQAKAARLLGLTPRQLGYALRKYKIEIKRL